MTRELANPSVTEGRRRVRTITNGKRVVRAARVSTKNRD